MELGHYLHSGPGAGGQLSPAPPLPRAPPPTSTFPVAPKSRGQGAGDPATPVREGAPLTVPNPAPTSRKDLGSLARQGHSLQSSPSSVQGQAPSLEQDRPPSGPKTRGSTHHPGGPAGLNQESSTHTPRPKAEAIKFIFLERQLRQRVTCPRSQGGRTAVRIPRWHGTGWSHPPTAPLGQGLPSRLSPRPQETSISSHSSRGQADPRCSEWGQGARPAGGGDPGKGPPGPAWLPPPLRGAAGSTLCLML